MLEKQLNERTILNQILTNRSFLMGVAMSLVIVYHFFCWVYNPIGPFNIGYVGVDIFLFLSGLGLTYSYENNSIIQFYKNRIKRIYPIYLVSIIVTYIVYKLNWNAFDLIANISTLGIYIKGGVNRYDWYLESLFSLYFLFPLFYYYGKIRLGGLVILLLAISFLLFQYNVPWWYDCILGRLPIFLYGVIFKYCTKSYKAISIIGISLYFPYRLFVSPFLASSGLTISLVIISLTLLDYSHTKIIESISYIRRHSLEFYIANLFVYWLFESTNHTTIERGILFIIIQLVATIIIVKINGFFHRFQLKIERKKTTKL